MDQVAEFRLLLLGVLIQAVPFIVLAAFFSFLLEVIVPENALPRLFGKNILIGILMAAASGFVIPACECCIVPLARRLRQRGVPLPVAITFLAAAPALNPIVIAGTNAAFITQKYLVVWRFGASFAIAVAAGLLFHFFDRAKNLSSDALPDKPAVACDCGADHSSGELSDRVSHGLEQAVSDFILMLSLIIISAALTSLAQAYIASPMMSLGANQVLSAPAMLLFAFVSSTCSSADSFVASAVSQFGAVPKMGFLLLGPILDIKLVLLHFALLPRRVAMFILITFPVLVIASLVILSFFI